MAYLANKLYLQLKYPQYIYRTHNNTLNEMHTFILEIELLSGFQHYIYPRIAIAYSFLNPTRRLSQELFKIRHLQSATYHH